MANEAAIGDPTPLSRSERRPWGNLIVAGNMGFLFAVTLMLISSIHISFGEEIVFAELNGVQLVSTPVPLISKSGESEFYRATKVTIRSIDLTGTLVSLSNIRIDGDVHHAWGWAFDQPTPVRPVFGPCYCDTSWIEYDSHLLIYADMVLDNVGGGFPGITEMNNGVSDVSLFGNAGLPAKSGLGPLFVADSTDAFSLHPAFRTNEVDFAYIVSPLAGEVTLAVGLSGNRGNAGETWQANFGFDGNPIVTVPFVVPEPAIGPVFASLLLAFLFVRRRLLVSGRVAVLFNETYDAFARFESSTHCRDLTRTTSLDQP